MQKPPPPRQSPQIISEDILESFTKWFDLEVLRVRAKYKLTEKIAINAIAMTVLGASVTSLKHLGKTVDYVISIMKGQDPS